MISIQWSLGQIRTEWPTASVHCAFSTTIIWFFSLIVCLWGWWLDPHRAWDILTAGRWVRCLFFFFFHFVVVNVTRHHLFPDSHQKKQLATFKYLAGFLYKEIRIILHMNEMWNAQAWYDKATSSINLKGTIKEKPYEEQPNPNRTLCGRNCYSGSVRSFLVAAKCHAV